MKRILLKTLCGCTKEIPWISHFPYKIEIPLMRELQNPFKVSEDAAFDPPDLKTRVFVLSGTTPEKGVDAVYIEEDK